MRTDLALRFRPVVRDKRLGPSRYMAERSCPLCRGTEARPVLRYEGYQFYTDSETTPPRVDVRQVMCEGCFAVFMNPVFTEEGFARLFAEAGASYGSASHRPAETVDWLFERGLLSPGARLVDIGCYDGDFIGQLPSSVAALGIDIDAPAIDRARQKYQGVPDRRFLCHDFEALSLESGVDLITMIMVLEHLPRPVEVLRRLAAQASRATRLVVEVPAIEHVPRGDISGYLTAQHLTHFSIASLHNCLARGGWEILTAQIMTEYGGYRVIAAPSVASCANLARGNDDLAHVLRYLRDWYGAVAQIESRLGAVTAPNCILRGGGLHTEYLYHLTSLFSSQRRFLIVDSDARKVGKTWRGIDIEASSVLHDVDWNQTQMVLSSYSHQEAMKTEAGQLGIPADRVISLYDVVYRH